MTADFVQLVVSGLATGAIYALVAMGFTLLWQTSATINFAQGEFVMLAAFAMLLLTGPGGLPLWLAFVLVMPLSALVLGGVFKRLVVDPVLPRGMLSLVIATIGLGIAAKNAVRAGVSAEAQPFPSLAPADPVRVLGVGFSLADLATLAVAFAAIGGLQMFLARTATGRRMQAAAQNPEAARVVGIDVERMALYTFGINGALAAVAALLAAPTYLAKFDMGETLGLYAFYAAIIGGFNQMRGALWGGLIVGVLANLCGAYISTAYRDAFVLGLLALVVMFRPEGLFGRVEERKV